MGGKSERRSNALPTPAWLDTPPKIESSNHGPLRRQWMLNAECSTLPNRPRPHSVRIPHTAHTTPQRWRWHAADHGRHADGDIITPPRVAKSTSPTAWTGRSLRRVCTQALAAGAKRQPLPVTLPPLPLSLTWGWSAVSKWQADPGIWTPDRLAPPPSGLVIFILQLLGLKCVLGDEESQTRFEIRACDGSGRQKRQGGIRYGWRCRRVSVMVVWPRSVVGREPRCW